MSDIYKRAGIVAGIYASFGIFWILASDELVWLVAGNAAEMSFVQTVKGLAYISLTAALVFYLTLFVLRRQAQLHAATDVSERRFRDMFEQAAVGIALVSPEGQWLRVNSRLCEFLGYSQEELLARSFLDITHPDDRAISIEYLEQFRRGQRDSFQEEKRYTTKSGDVVWALVSVACSRYKDGSQDFYITIVEDIGPRKRAEEARALLEAQLRQSQKLEAIGRLAGGVAHDFNNMLGVILGYTEFVMQQLGKDNVLYSDLEQVQVAGTRATALTRQLLAFARKETIAPRAMDLNKYIRDSTKLLSRLLGEDIQLAFKPEDDLWSIYMDPSQVDQLLANLTVNSRDAIAREGRVEICTSNVRIGASDALVEAGLSPGDMVCLTFSDSGCGMSEEVQKQIFEPFFTTKELGKGTGLGLATVYGIVQQNKGQIRVSSAPGQGTVFTLYFPRHAGLPDDSGRRVVKAAEGQETIFMVEDETQLLQLCQHSLERKGYKVFAFNDPNEAVLAAAASAERIDLLLTDVMMPGMTGANVAKGVWESWPGTPVLYMSGHTENVITEHGVLPQGMHYIQKPFSPAVLAARVREILDAHIT